MLLYQYPNQNSVSEERRNFTKKYADNKKIKNSIIRNFVIAIGIIIISGFSQMLFAKILLIFVALIMIANSLFLHKCSFPKKSKYLVTYIYDDKIINSQYDFFQKKIYRYTIYYDNIEKTSQTLMGGLKINLNSFIKCEVIKKDGTISEREYVKDVLVLNFNDTDSKYYLINNLKRKIKYK